MRELSILSKINWDRSRFGGGRTWNLSILSKINTVDFCALGLTAFNFQFYPRSTPLGQNAGAVYIYAFNSIQDQQ